MRRGLAASYHSFIFLWLQAETWVVDITLQGCGISYLSGLKSITTKANNEKGNNGVGKSKKENQCLE
jgi:hypothetical protein